MPFAARLFGILMVVAGVVLTLVVYLAAYRFDPTYPWWIRVPVMAFFFVGPPALGAAKLWFTRVRTDPDGLLISDGLSKRKLPWSEIAAFGIVTMTEDAGLVGPRDRNSTTPPFIWAFRNDFDPAHPRSPVRWRNPSVSIPFHGWPLYPARRYLSELVELRDRLEALRQARSVPQPLSASLAAFLAELNPPDR